MILFVYSYILPTIAQNIVRVNTATFEELLTWQGIGELIAKSIIEERNIKYFTSWQDLKNRVKNYPLSAKDDTVF